MMTVDVDTDDVDNDNDNDTKYALYIVIHMIVNVYTHHCIIPHITLFSVHCVH